MTYEHTLMLEQPFGSYPKGLPLVIEYNYSIHGGKKFPKIETIIIDNKWDLTEVIDHSLKEDLNSRIFRELNKDIYNK